jgi:VCBS repeat-containing protein
MDICTKQWPSAALRLVVVAGALALAPLAAHAGNPHGARYCATGDSVFWFIQASDTHIGARGSTDADRLGWLVNTGLSTIRPSFIVVTGDLTDSTNGNWLGYPNGPYQAEWNEYKAILAAARVGADVYFDLPGNHDAYNDQGFAYYLANSIQGQATGRTQVSWTRQFAFGTYHFLGVNSAGNTGEPFSLSFPFGDPAGLDASELDYIRAQLSANADARLTFVFGHHPVTDTGASDDTWLFYGHGEFISELDLHAASAYGYGHTHDYSEALFAGNDYTGLMSGGGIYYENVASLGKSSPQTYSVVAVDCDGVSAATQSVGTWPVVLITAPLDRQVGGVTDPYAYSVPNSAANPVRALVFDTAAISQVRFRIDSGTTWYTMTRVQGSTALWQGSWDASALSGNHTIEVQATGSATRSHTIGVTVTAPPVHHPPVATDDAYSTQAGVVLSEAAPGVLANDTDPDGDPLTAQDGTQPAHGSVSLEADGSFTYAPSAGFAGTDTFTYRAGDGALLSEPATVTITVTPATDTVTITTATYTRKTKVLKVEATSSKPGSATLTVAGYSQMTYSAKTKKYTFQATVASPPAEVTVTSSLGGTATKAVSVR